MKGRVFEVSMGDLDEKPDNAHQLVKLRVEDVKGKTAYTVFNGLRFSNDKLRGLVKKWYSLVQANVDAKTNDGYILRLFVIGTTKRRQAQQKKATYANSAQIARMRWRIKELVAKATAELDIKNFVSAMQSNTIGKKVEKACSTIFPLQNMHIYRVKVIKSPKFDTAKLGQLHSDFQVAATQDVGAPVSQ